MVQESQTRPKDGPEDGAGVLEPKESLLVGWRTHQVLFLGNMQGDTDKPKALAGAQLHPRAD